jgi:GPI ethanolamine phosphate transferase 3 subunit O
MKTTSRRLWDLWAILLVLVGLYWFAASFFLAKRSLEHVSSCDEAASLLKEQLGLSTEAIHILQRQRIVSNSEESHRRGCWMDRRVDSLIILLVDALRFDFAYYNLPQSIGQRLQQLNSTSRLFQFIADPPTVTMQRLKALTTGGLPTFADISGNFGGAKVPEDTWVKQLLKSTNFHSRGLNFGAKVGFVGDDTWEDLFPNYFTESYPYPSFNTRDLDTVDNGCFRRLPGLLQKLRTNDETESELEAVIVHFLGVDHVGHTYGPHNQHMDAKLRQMDNALQSVLQRLDESDHCHTALIFGDHGMTEDGNHGGGTTEETHAALFVHTSPSCGAMTDAVHLEQKTSSEWVSQSFATLHQIDLVPVIATLLGLPIPFANVGGLIPSILPGLNVQQMTAALALNAAQVWRYLTVYSETANRLPDLNLLHDRLQVAVASYSSALRQHQDEDDDKYLEASGLFKLFLTEALDLGQRVWTRFDNIGMLCGIFVLMIGLFLYALLLWLPHYQMSPFRLPSSHIWEFIVTIVFMLFTCGMLSFSNSYILKEENAIMFSMAVLSCIIALRVQSDVGKFAIALGILLLPIASRMNELFLSGHGMDPSVRIHVAHNAVVFLSSILALGTFRWFLYQKRITASFGHAITDCMSLLFFALSWWEKRSLDPDRNGFGYCRAGLALILGGFVVAVTTAFTRSVLRDSVNNKSLQVQDLTGDFVTIIAKILIAIMAVTGPSAAPSLVLYTFQATVLYFLALTEGPSQVHSVVVAGLWRLVTRHIFFATNHGCYFNRLQYSAAFIATKEFYFALGGISLFLNTFGWEMVGIVFAWLMSQNIGRNQIWRAYGFYQIIEALASCISVCVLRRHLMVWDIYAPHFLFAAIYTILNMLSQLSVLALTP